MTQFYKQKLVCIARCKNEIHIIKKWYKSLSFVDVFVMTDNNSTDGTYEYLKSLPNVIVIRVENFDEGRDFQILLKIAKSLKPEWLLKIDCDEIFEENATKNMHKLLNQKKYNAVFFRQYNFSYLTGNNKGITKKFKAGLKLVRNSKKINILNVFMHSGSFIFYKKPVLSNFRVKHYGAISYDKAKNKYDNYGLALKNKGLRHGKQKTYKECLDKNSKLNLLRYNNSEVFKKIEKSSSIDTLNKYGLLCLFITDDKQNLIKPLKNKLFFKLFVKRILFLLIVFFHLDKIFLITRSKIKDKKTTKKSIKNISADKK